MNNDRLHFRAVQVNQRNRIRYRVGQFLGGLQAGVTGAEREEAARLLAPAAFCLFQRMPADAQRHSLNVLFTLQRADFADPDLAAAALLHDVGKVAAADAGAPSGLWFRGPLVLAEAIMPGRLAALANDDPDGGWRYAIWVHFEHPHVGADWAHQAGCSDLTCRLIQFHQSNPEAGADEHFVTLLAALRWADDRN